jgi:hypothetical protein
MERLGQEEQATGEVLQAPLLQGLQCRHVECGEVRLSGPVLLDDLQVPVGQKERYGRQTTFVTYWSTVVMVALSCSCW